MADRRSCAWLGDRRLRDHFLAPGLSIRRLAIHRLAAMLLEPTSHALKSTWPEIQYRVASAADVAAMGQSRRLDPVAGPADARMGAYLDGLHHPQQALLPRVAWLATVELAVIGYVAGHLSRRFDCAGELQYLFVAPPYRRIGVARELVTRLAEWFVAQGAHRICVNVDDASAGARPFYESLGAITLHPHWMAWPDIASAARK